MNITMKRLMTVSTVALSLAIVSSDAFALGRHKSSGYKGWTNSSTTSGSTGSSDVSAAPATNDASNDSNPVPEPTSMLMLGSAIAGFGGYRGLRKKFLGK